MGAVVDERTTVAICRRAPRALSRSYQEMISCLSAANQSWANTAPVLILTAVQLVAEKTGEKNRHAYYDAGQAVAFLTLQAQSQGLGIRQMEGFDHAIAREVCRVPRIRTRSGDGGRLSRLARRASERKTPRSRSRPAAPPQGLRVRLRWWGGAKDCKP